MLGSSQTRRFYPLHTLCMGVDPALHDSYPFVFINGEKYYYGKEPEYGQWMVSHESYGKWYWCFQENRQAMIDFLENLPESAMPPIIDGKPMWMIAFTLTGEERERIWKEHRENLRQLLDEKRRTGRTFPYDKEAVRD